MPAVTITDYVLTGVGKIGVYVQLRDNVNPAVTFTSATPTDGNGQFSITTPPPPADYSAYTSPVLGGGAAWTLYDPHFRIAYTRGDTIISAIQTPTEAVLVSGVDASAGEQIQVTLTANRVMGLPLNGVAGQKLHLIVTQGGAGGFALTFAAGITVTNFGLNMGVGSVTDAWLTCITPTTWVIWSPSVAGQDIAPRSVSVSSGPYVPSAPAGGAVFSGLVTFNSNTAGGGTLLLNNASGVTLGVTFTPTLYVHDNYFGTATASAFIAYNEFAADADNADLSGAQGGGGTFLFVGDTLTAGAKGARNTLVAFFNQTGATTATAQTYYVAFGAQSQAAASAGGAVGAGNQKGNLFASNPNVHLKTGAGLYWQSVISEEVDIEVQTSAATVDKIGLFIVQLSTDAVQGSRADAGMALTQQISGTAPGWNIGIAFGAPSGWWPIKSTGTLEGTYAATVGGGPAMSAANGTDWSAVTFSGSAFKSTGFAVDPNGVLKLGVAGAAFIDNVTAGQSVTIRTNNGATSLATFDGATANFLPGALVVVAAGQGIVTSGAGALNVGTANATSVVLGSASALVNYNYAVTALGGGAAPTLGTIGGSGPAAAAQNSWLKVLIAGTASYIPVWR